MPSGPNWRIPAEDISLVPERENFYPELKTLNPKIYTQNHRPRTLTLLQNSPTRQKSEVQG